MALALTINGAAVSNVRWDLSAWSQSGDLGSTSTAEVVIDDPSGTLSVTEWKQVTIDESACSQPRLFTGYVHEVKVERMDPYSGAARRWTLSCIDANSLLFMRLITGSDGNRPAETWSARKAWLLGSEYLQGAVSDTGKIASGLDSVQLAATDYRDQSPDQVIQDLVALTGLNGAPLNYFVFWDPAPSVGSPRLGLFLNSEDDTSWVSSLALSNVASEVDLSSVWPAEATLTRRGDRIYSGYVVTWPSGRRYVTRSATATTYIARDFSAYRPNVGSAQAALSHANNRLEERKAPEEIVQATVELPASHAGLILPGQGLDVRFTHLPGYSTTTRLRVISVDWRLIGPDRYLLTLQLSRPRITAAGGGRPPLLPAVQSIELVQHQSGIRTGGQAMPDLAPTPGNLLVCAYSDYQDSCSADTIFAGRGWTKLGSTVLVNIMFRNRYVGVYAKIAGNGESTGFVANTGCDYGFDLSEWAGITSLSLTAASAGNQAGAQRTESVATPQRPSAALIVAAGLTAPVSDTDLTGLSWSAGFTELSDFRLSFVSDGANRLGVAYLVDTSADTGYACTVTAGGNVPGNAGTALVLAGVFETPPTPPVGAPVPQAPAKESPDGTRTQFTVQYAFAPGTLRVLVDGIDQTAAIVSSDPSAGTFTLSFAPESDERVEVVYVKGQ